MLDSHPPDGGESGDVDKSAPLSPVVAKMEPMSDPVRAIAERVRGRVLSEGVDLARDEVLAARYATEEVRRYSERALAGAHAPLGDEPGTAREVVASLTGYGPLQPFFDDPTVEEIWINSPTRVFVARAGVPELTTLVLSDREVRDLVERMLQHSGRRVDLSSPFVDASLPDGRACTSRSPMSPARTGR